MLLFSSSAKIATVVVLCCLIEYLSAACSIHSDCKNQSLCFESQCIAATRVCGSRPCNKDCHCRSFDFPWRNRGRGCKCGRCYELKKPRCSRKECSCTKDCGGLSICFRRHCVEAEVTGQRCEKCKDCNEGERCVSRMCLRPLPGNEVDKCCDCPPHCSCIKNKCCCKGDKSKPASAYRKASCGR